jgi:hypothetical protein
MPEKTIVVAGKSIETVFDDFKKFVSLGSAKSAENAPYFRFRSNRVRRAGNLRRNLKN